MCDRSAFILADQERLGGISPHISPFMNVADAGNLLQGAGFSLCTGRSFLSPLLERATKYLLAVDTDYIQVDYPNALTLMEHVQGMGENNASVLKGRMTKDSLLAAASIYQAMYGLEDGLVPATFQVYSDRFASTTLTNALLGNLSYRLGSSFFSKSTTTTWLCAAITQRYLHVSSQIKRAR